jgi:hypothetical protein
MRKIIIAILSVALLPAVAYAACTTHTYYVNGRYTTCTTCCTGNMCNTTCY